MDWKLYYTDWAVTNLCKNNYRLTNGDKVIAIKLSSTLSENYELNFNLDMSVDGIIFYPKVYATLSDENPILGDVLRYDENGKFIERGLISAEIITTNVENAKTVLEMLFV